MAGIVMLEPPFFVGSPQIIAAGVPIQESTFFIHRRLHEWARGNLRHVL